MQREGVRDYKVHKMKMNMMLGLSVGLRDQILG